METHKRRSREKYTRTQHKNGRSLVCICAAAAAAVGWISPVALPESGIRRKKLAATRAHECPGAAAAAGQFGRLQFHQRGRVNIHGESRTDAIAPHVCALSLIEW
jgi:hypothetical protein